MSMGAVTGAGVAAPVPAVGLDGSAVEPCPGFDGLSGSHRAAALLLLLGETEGAAIWRLLDEDEVRKVSRAMVQLGSLEPKAVERLIVDFLAKLAKGGGLSSNVERTEALLAKIFPPEQVGAIMSEVRGTAAKRVWASLTAVEPAELAAFLAGEHPQTTAVVLSKLRPDYAARLLQALPEPFAIESLGRMLRMDGVQKEALRHIEETLRNAFIGAGARKPGSDAHERLAEVFNSFDRQTETRFLAALDGIERGAAKRIRDLMFTFDDLLKLEPGAVQTLLRKTDTALLCRALKGADARVRGFFTAQMSMRAAKNLADDMESMGPVRLKEVDEAQARMTEITRELVEAGEITILRTGNEEELVF